MHHIHHIPIYTYIHPYIHYAYTHWSQTFTIVQVAVVVAYGTSTGPRPPRFRTSCGLPSLGAAWMPTPPWQRPCPRCLGTPWENHRKMMVEWDLIGLPSGNLTQLWKITIFRYFLWENPLQMPMFSSYLKLPGGTCNLQLILFQVMFKANIPKPWDIFQTLMQFAIKNG